MKHEETSGGTANHNSGHRPLVSVLTPSFNQARWLEENLWSVAQQSYPNVEHIVMDAGSKDGSVEILERASARVQWISKPDRGQSHALNKAFDRSGGDIIGWLNSDDAYFDTRVVEEVVAAFEADRSVDVVYGHAAQVSADGRVLLILWSPPSQKGLVLRTLPQPACFIRRSAIRDRFVDESFDYGMDYELWLRLSKSHRFARLNRVLAIDRHYSGRKSHHSVQIAREYDRLAETYPYRKFTRRFGALVEVGYRLAGLRVVSAGTRPLAFHGTIDSGWKLAGRQALVRRSRMDWGTLHDASGDRRVEAPPDHEGPACPSRPQGSSGGTTTRGRGGARPGEL